MNNNTDSQRLAIVIHELRRFRPGSLLNGNQLDQHVTAARSIIRLLDVTSLLQRAARLDDQVLIVSRLQDIAYHEPDSGGVPDIAQWCVRQWLRLLQGHAEVVEVLQGLGQAWLLRSQTSLARIHSDEGSSSSDEAAETTHAATEANARRHTANYVEARGTLIPATEYFARSVSLAERQGVLQGPLLSLAAEAYMSLGNVSYTPGNEQHFRRALIYLQRASQIHRFTLTPYLQRYLDDYGRFID